MNRARRWPRPKLGRFAAATVFSALPGCFLGLLLLSGCKPPPEGSLAQINGQPVTEETFRYWWSRDTPLADTPGLREAVLSELVERAILVQAAKARGFDRDPATVEAVESLLIARLKETELEPKLAAVRVSEDEVRAYYQARQQRDYALPEQRRVAVLWFETRGEQPLIDRYKTRLEQAREQVQTNRAAFPAAKGFGPLSLRNSEHAASRFKGGDAGWLEARDRGDSWRNAVAEIAAGLSVPGELSPVTARPEGLFVLRLIEHRPAQFRPFEAVRQEITRQLRNEKRSLAESRFFSELREQSDVRLDAGRLAALPQLPVLKREPEAIAHSQIHLPTP